MQSGEVEALIECLVANPHDSDALARAHRQGEADPQSYAYLLEQVGTRTEDPSYASHWLSEAANIWSVTLGDAHKAARVLMIAVDRDPTQPLAADRLAQLYRDKGDVKALVAMLDRRVRLLTPMLTSSPQPDDALRGLVAGLHDELGKLWNDPPLDQPRKAIDHFKRSIELDPSGAFAIFSVREIYKSLQQWDEATAMYAMELAVEQDPERRLMLFRDEAATRRLAGDWVGVTRALRSGLEDVRSRGIDDPALAQEVAGSLLDRAEAGSPIDDNERAYGADLLAGLAESFDGEHGLAYAGGALDLSRGHDRAMQLYAYYAQTLGGLHADSVALRYHAYLEANPSGAIAKDARVHLAASYEAAGQPELAQQVLAPLHSPPEEARRPSGQNGQAAGVGAASPARAVRGSGDSAGYEVIDTDEVEDAARPSPQGVKQVALDAARAFVAKSNKPRALEKYLEVLAVDPLEPESLSWVEDFLRTRRDYTKLRDVLWASARAMGAHDSIESKKARLREIAGLSEGNLKDLDGAIQAWRQVLSLDRGDEAARQSLVRALEKGQRWDDLANVYEQEASASGDVDTKIQLEKKLAALNEGKRKDPLAAAEAWSRIADLTPDDEHPIGTAADFFEKAGKHELAAAVIYDHAEGVSDVPARAALLERLGRLLSRDGADDLAGAGRAFQRAAEAESNVARWAAAEKAFASSESWTLAANAADQVGDLAGPDDVRGKAEALARASKYLRDGGDEAAATAHLESAYELAPDVESHALTLMESYRAAGDLEKLAKFLVARGAGHADKATRISALREAAKLYEAAPLSDEDAARGEWRKLLEVEEDAEALEHLVGIAISRDELAEGAALLKRLGALASTNEEKAAVALREAELLSRAPDTVDAAITRYESILETLDPKSRLALRAIADLEEKREAPKAAAVALERELKLATDPQARGEVAGRLVRNYVAAGDDIGTFTALEAVRAADPEDFDALNRLAALAEKLERWEPLKDLLAQQIEVEGDDDEISTLTQKRAAILADKLGRGDEALAALQELADAGNSLVREAYVLLGDRLGWRGIVATKLVDWWFPEAQSESRTAALTGAFERFAVVGREEDAVRVGVEILRASRDPKLAAELEALAAKTSSEIGLTAAQEILGLELNGAPRASELVRQAEMRVKAGMAWGESVQHGETGLGGLLPDEVEPLLVRLAALIATPHEAIDLYERQVSRSRGGEAREKSLIRAAQVAGDKGDLKRARTFFDLAVSGTPSDATLDALVQATSGETHGDGLRRALAEAMAGGGEGVRDGGRSRANFLRRAALLAHHDLHDEAQAFAWLTDALVAHADAATLDALQALAEEAKALPRIDEVITRVLTEVFDGPLVRLMLARRAKVRKELLDDRVGLRPIFKKLHDLSPTDEAVMAELMALLTEQGDHRSMIKLFEDQILRSKDQAIRAELGRKVAQIWEAELADPREAADAWRRVLRLRPGDEEATQGLDRAKTNMLRKGAGEAPVAAPPRPPSVAPPAGAPLTPAAPPVASAASAKTPSPPLAEPVAEVTGEVAQAEPTSTEPPPRDAIPEAPLSTDNVDELDLEAEDVLRPDVRHSPGPRLVELLGSNDSFTESDTTHTSIDVRRNLAAARAIEATAQGSAAAPAAGNGAPSSGRLSRPPPLPTPYELNEPPTAPGRRMDAAAASRPGRPAAAASEQNLGATDENAAFDFSEKTVSRETPVVTRGKRGKDVPPARASTKDVGAADVQDDEDVLVVDEFVEDVDDEFEDVAEPSKPQGPLRP